MMKRILFFLLFGVIISCSTANNTSTNIQEEQFLITRKYIGNFVDYYHTGPEVVGGSDLIWIKTSVYNTFGKISVYGRKCDFTVGDKIYLKPIYSTPGSYGNWEYQLENDSSVVYRVSDIRFENNVFTRTGSL
jgi:hypothetical protein